eukprot:gene18159-22228_t
MELDCVVADVLTQIIRKNRHLQPAAQSCAFFSKFQSSYEPEVGVLSYLQRLRQHGQLSDACLILMLIFVDRCVETRGLVLSSLNVHRLVLLG